MGICHLFKQPKPIILPVKHWIALHKHYSVIHGGKKNAKKTTKPFGECRKEGSQRTAEVADIRYQPLCTFTLFFFLGKTGERALIKTNLIVVL